MNGVYPDGWLANVAKKWDAFVNEMLVVSLKNERSGMRWKSVKSQLQTEKPLVWVLSIP